MEDNPEFTGQINGAEAQGEAQTETEQNQDNATQTGPDAQSGPTTESGPDSGEKTEDTDQPTESESEAPPYYQQISEAYDEGFDRSLTRNLDVILKDLIAQQYRSTAERIFLEKVLRMYEEVPKS